MVILTLSLTSSPFINNLPNFLSEYIIYPSIVINPNANINTPILTFLK